MSHPIKALFLDIGGVLLTNGWEDVYKRQPSKAASFQLEVVS